VGQAFITWNGPPISPQELTRKQQEKERECPDGKEILIAFMAICFAHCRNAKVEEHQPGRQVKRAGRRAGKPVVSFHTIDIEPSKQILRTEGRIAETGITKALHICRGHFAHYTAEKPLFGKLTGTFYRPLHLRGSAEKGVSMKDYRVPPSTSV